jgi:DnaK suppressor protein
VKATAKKSTPVKKPVAKAKGLPLKKAAGKSAPKVLAKPVAKKPAAKQPAARPPQKPVVPAKSKTALKPVPKAISKAPSAALKLNSKPIAAKVNQKKPTKPVKAVSKANAKPVTPKSKLPVKPVKVLAKPTAKSSAKPPVKAALVKASAKPVPSKTVSGKSPANKAMPTGLPVKGKAVATTSKTAAKPVVPALAQPAAKAAPVVLKAGVVISPASKTPRTSKSGFISPSNIAPKAMEVSTAAKTNFTMSAPVLVPPPQLIVHKDAKLVNNWKKKTAAQLTDDEAIAMPDTEYMSPLQLAFFRLKLVQLKKDILSNAGETTEHLREDTSVVPDPADRATIEEEHALELRTRDRERKLLKKIEQSMSRIDAEDYGYCDETGEAIGVARLIARPTANLSIEAQQRRELKQKMFGD